MSKHSALRNGKILASLIVVSISILASCAKKSEISKAPTSGNASINLNSLKLSKALQVSLSSGLQKAANVKTGQANLNLVSKKKSTEACQTLKTIDELLANARSNGSFLCHMEVEKIQFGKKIDVKAINSPESDGNFESQIWIDNSNDENLKVYLCEKRKLIIAFDISNYGGDGLIKGSSQMKFEGTFPATEWTSAGSFTYTTNDEFDFTKPGTKIVKSKSKSSSSSGPSNSDDYLSYADLKLVDSGVSSLLVSRGGSYSHDDALGSGTPTTGTHDEQSAILFNGTLGQALYKNGSTLTRATFNSEGYKVDTAQATADVIIDKLILPAKLPSTFSAQAPSGWDCSTTDSLTIDLSNQERKSLHDACDIEWPEFNSCGGDDFEDGQTEQ
jgi:hypothetical protein